MSSSEVEWKRRQMGMRGAGEYVRCRCGHFKSSHLCSTSYCAVGGCCCPDFTEESPDE